MFKEERVKTSLNTTFLRNKYFKQELWVKIVKYLFNYIILPFLSSSLSGIYAIANGFFVVNSVDIAARRQ